MQILSFVRLFVFGFQIITDSFRYFTAQSEECFANDQNRLIQFERKEAMNYWLFELLVRYGLLIGTGLLLTWISVHRAKVHAEEFSHEKYAEETAVVKSIQEENNNAPGRYGYIYHIEAEYFINGQPVVSVSQNTVHSDSDYEIGEQIEILYDRTNPSFFYIADDRNFRTENGILRAFGIGFTLIGLVLLAMRLMTH